MGLCEDMVHYFPNFDDQQISERRFLFEILSEKKGSVLENLISGARDHKSLKKSPEEDELIQINSEVKTMLIGIIYRKHKYSFR